MISFALTHTDLFIRENNKNKNKVYHHLVITEKKHLRQGYHFNKLLKTFTKFYYRYKDLVYKYNST